MRYTIQLRLRLIISSQFYLLCVCVCLCAHARSSAQDKNSLNNVYKNINGQKDKLCTYRITSDFCAAAIYLYWFFCVLSLRVIRINAFMCLLMLHVCILMCVHIRCVLTCTYMYFVSITGLSVSFSFVLYSFVAINSSDKNNIQLLHTQTHAFSYISLKIDITKTIGVSVTLLPIALARARQPFLTEIVWFHFTF